MYPIHLVAALGCAVGLFLSAWPLAADQLRLGNGDVVSGRLMRLSATHCLFETPYEATLRIARDRVVGLTTTAKVVVELRSGDRVVGTIGTRADGSLLIRSPRLGPVAASLAEIAGIDPRAPAKEPGRRVSVRGKGVGAAPDDARNEPLGEAPEDLQRLFLRESAVLLKPGERDLTLSLSYARDQVTDVVARELSFTSTLQYGLPERTEIFLSIPWSGVQFEARGEERFRSGVGDVSGGIKHLLVQEDAHTPDLIASLDVSAPTGGEPDLTDVPGLRLGAGAWSLAGGLNMIRSYDPLVLFGTLGYRHVFDDEPRSQAINVADALIYNVGVGFAVNQNVTLSGQFLAEFGERRDGVHREPMVFRSGLTLSPSRTNVLDSSVAVGLNDDAVDTVLDLAFSHRF